VVRLTKVFWQAAASRIIVNSHRINLGLMPGLATPVGDSDSISCQWTTQKQLDC
jgi:exodeoxyribonuclease V alpha subunit